MIYRITFEVEIKESLQIDVKNRVKLKIIGYPSLEERAKIIKYVEKRGAD